MTGPVGRSRPMEPVTLTDGTPVVLRPIRPEDESALTALYERLSPQTAYQRFFTVIDPGAVSIPPPAS